MAIALACSVPGQIDRTESVENVAARRRTASLVLVKIVMNALHAANGRSVLGKSVPQASALNGRNAEVHREIAKPGPPVARGGEATSPASAPGRSVPVRRAETGRKETGRKAARRAEIARTAVVPEGAPAAVAVRRVDILPAEGPVAASLVHAADPCASLPAGFAGRR